MSASTSRLRVLTDSNSTIADGGCKKNHGVSPRFFSFVTPPSYSSPYPAAALAQDDRTRPALRRLPIACIIRHFSLICMQKNVFCRKNVLHELMRLIYLVKLLPFSKNHDVFFLYFHACIAHKTRHLLSYVKTTIAKWSTVVHNIFTIFLLDCTKILSLKIQNTYSTPLFLLCRCIRFIHLAL